MKKGAFFLLLSIGLLLLPVSCGKQAPPADETVTQQVVELTVWAAEEDMELLQEITAAFQDHYSDQASFRITCQPQGESNCKDVLLGDLENGADVFTFADDQVAALAAAGALDPIEDAASIREANLSAAVEAASVDGTLYAYPLTADNGYFLYYNKAYFSQDDVQTLDRILAVAEEAGRQVSMDWSSAWYVYAFFGNTGLEVGLNEDGLTNYCTWNGTDGPISGVDVAESMLSVAASPGFSSRTDEAFLQGVQDGSLIAGVSGVWNTVAIQEAWGENAGAVKLPTFTCGGQQVQMASFSGCKLIGVNAYSEYPEWAFRSDSPLRETRNGRSGLRSGSPARRTSACVLSGGDRVPPTAPPQPRRKSRTRRPWRPCWPRRNFLRSSG